MCIVVGEFGEEESAHSDNGANQKDEKKKTRARTSPVKEKAGLVGWLGRARPAQIHKYTYKIEYTRA